MKPRLKILITGVVQGVGFRPFVYNLARSLGLKGYVINSSKGVTIEIEGDKSPYFFERLSKEAPPLSKIMNIETISMPYFGYEDFQIRESEDEGSFTLVSSDVSICPDCFREMMDRNDRRYLYPFINCTNCGPRYTITKSVPYDRPNTTMAVFSMCPDCKKEYTDPADRRFHAQPNACPICGPQVTLKDKSGKLKGKKTDPIKGTIRLLKEGRIVAIKGLGGFHLACDATNEEAVARLRLKKRKSNKPFALMSPDVATVKKYCEVSNDEQALLLSHERPIVLLNKLPNNLPEAVSPNNPCIGFMLPYTPLHYLLFYYPVASSASHGKGGAAQVNLDKTMSANFEALVMTSGNISEEPIVIDNNEAVEKLSAIADAFLMHNRDIFMRADDSVVRMMGVGGIDKKEMRRRGEMKKRRNGDTEGKITASSATSAVPDTPAFIRRSRGYVPDPIPLHDDGPEVLGCGADIKNVFTLTKGSFAIPSQHIGDMENFETLQFFEESLENLKSVYRVNPVALAYDLHPMYLSSQWALRQENIKKTAIQHHYAHVASVMAEKGMKDKVIGVAFDGTGYGDDGNLWGGEFLIADIKECIRAGHLSYIPLPGGEAAVKEPWRIAVSYIRKAVGDDTLKYLKSIGFVERYGTERIQEILKIADARQFSPLSSGAGRLFDAISAMIGLCDKSTFEGEPAIALEAIAASRIDSDYPVDIKFRKRMEIDFSHAVLGIMDDIVSGEERGVISAKLHNTFLTSIVRVVEKLSALHSIRDIVLCGGVFQNMYLLRGSVARLVSAGLNVHIHEKVPTNDAAVSLGQAYIIRERIKAGLL